MEERIALFREYETGVFSVSDLCGRYGIGRETFYVWKRRRRAARRRGLSTRAMRSSTVRMPPTTGWSNGSSRHGDGFRISVRRR